MKKYRPITRSAHQVAPSVRHREPQHEHNDNPYPEDNNPTQCKNANKRNNPTRHPAVDPSLVRVIRIKQNGHLIADTRREGTPDARMRGDDLAIWRLELDHRERCTVLVVTVVHYDAGRSPPVPAKALDLPKLRPRKEEEDQANEQEPQYDRTCAQQPLGRHPYFSE
jgi:hypothetical protein